MTDVKKNEKTASEIEQMIARAKKREEEILRVRKASPVDIVAGAPMFVNPRKELVRLYAPECLPKRDPDDPTKVLQKPKRSPFFAPQRDLLKYVNRGYVPVLNEDGEYVQDEGDVLFTRSYEIAQAELLQAAAESQRRMGQPLGKSEALGVKEEIEVSRGTS